jgi:hypothetical protein
MNFDLYTIDWTAIGSIVTFIAMIIAYWTIHISDKQNKSNQRLQLLLVQREIEQKRLDDLVENIMIINDSMQPIIVADYSVKLTKGIFTEDDRHFIDEMAANDISNNNRLSVQLIKYDRNESAKKVLITLSNMRQKYGEWVRDLSILNLYKTNYIISPDELRRMILTMAKISKEIAPEYEKNIHNVINEKNNDLNKAINLMNIFCYTISAYLNEQKKIFEDELCAFVKEEQKRIDSMIFHDSIN